MKSMHLLMTVAALLAGCRSAPRDADFNAGVEPPGRPLSAPKDQLLPASFDADEPEILSQPPAVTVQPESLPAASAEALTIECLQQTALANNPAVAQAAARVEALRGKWVQVGLAPNPSIGYLASEIGNDGRGGQQGGFVGQEFVTGGKLDLNRAVVSQEIERAEQQLLATQLRVANDVRLAGYAVLVAQRRVELAEQLVTLSGQAVEASQALKEAAEISGPALLQTEVDQGNAVILLQTTQNELAAAWRRLSAAVGCDLTPQYLAGDVAQLPCVLDWDEQLARITAASPELGSAMADISRAQLALRRAQAEPIPNVVTQASVQYDDHTTDTIAGVQAGIPLPLWNRNQGGRREAQAQVAEARRNADRVELDLKRRLAAVYQQYSTARMQAETYSTTILPKARQAYELIQRGYSLGEVGYLDLLNAQRTFAQTNLAYLDSLSALWSSWTEIDGMLLTGSLEIKPE